MFYINKTLFYYTEKCELIIYCSRKLKTQLRDKRITDRHRGGGGKAIARKKKDPGGRMTVYFCWDLCLQVFWKYHMTEAMCSKLEWVKSAAQKNMSTIYETQSWMEIY